MAYLEKKITLKSFKKTTNKKLGGCFCAFNLNHFIDYNEECYVHPKLNITICKQCRNENKSIASKFHNVPREYGDYIYDSTFEAEFAKQLDLKLKAGLIKGWNKQVKIEINVKIVDNMPVLTSETVLELKEKGIEAYHITNYYMDFVVTNNDGSKTFYETKGVELSAWKIKFRLTEILFRDKVELIVVKKRQYKMKSKNSI